MCSSGVLRADLHVRDHVTKLYGIELFMFVGRCISFSRSFVPDMAKRKRDERPVDERIDGAHDVTVNQKKIVKSPTSAPLSSTPQNGRQARDVRRPVTLQVITGSYERVLHGFTAQIPSQTFRSASTYRPKSPQPVSDVEFTDTFLFTAHASSVRCLALSRSKESSKCILATGGADERINLYSISSAPPAQHDDDGKPAEPSLSTTAVLVNPKNKELGSLIHHSRPVTKLQFLTKGKLFSSADDNVIAISRTRDWTVLSTIKAPIPKPIGRPSGDTAGPGEVPAGVNDFAIHPSMKLMMTVGKGEKCMRLWNIVTGKKAGVLNFDRTLLQQVGEGKHGLGEGRRVIWTEDGERFIVCFENGAAVFGMDCEPQAILRPNPPSKLHDVVCLSTEITKSSSSTLALSTEDGRITLFDLGDIPKSATTTGNEDDLPKIESHAQIGGVATGHKARVKACTFLSVRDESLGSVLCVTGSSDGAVRIWSVDNGDLTGPAKSTTVDDATESHPRQVGQLIATNESETRITCLSAFVMDDGERHAEADEHVDGDDAGQEAEESDDFGGLSSDKDDNTQK